MYDAALFYQKSAAKPVWFDSSGFVEGSFILCTLHRAENTDSKERLHSIFEGLRNSGLNTFLPLHPRTKDRIASFNIAIPDNVKLIDPLGYLEMVWMEKNCLIVATDSGGVQKEAFFHGKRCVTLRDETEWIELVDAGFNTLTGANSELIASALVTSPAPINSKTNIYGDGNAGGKILSILCGEVDARDAHTF
jgi:UDP-GlcNAc3NAcA epimerase